MLLKEYLLMILKSLNPDKHRQLVKTPFFYLVRYLGILMVLCLLVSVIIMIPMLKDYQDDIAEEMAAFDEFQIDIDVSSAEPVEILSKPRIVIDLEKEELSNEWILITNDSVMYKTFIFFGVKEEPFSDYSSVKSEKSASFYSKIVIFLLPAVLFWIGILHGIKYVILISLFSVLGWVFFISPRYHITWKKSLKVAVFTATPMVILDLALWPVKVMFIIPVLVYVVYFVLGLIMVSERKPHHQKHHS